MLKLSLKREANDTLTVLCLGAHSDDIEIGCGGSLLQLSQAHNKVRFYWVVFSATGDRAVEARQAAELFTGKCEKEIVMSEFRDGFFPYCGGQMKEFFEELKRKVDPDLIFTHWQGDAHQDHRHICELTWNTFRNHQILEYEIPKYDGDLGRPNLFVPLDAPFYGNKVDFLLQTFKSQSAKRWFSRETFLGLMRLRGMESNAPSGYAEAFHARKVTVHCAV